MSQRPRLPAYLAERSFSPIVNEQIPTEPPEPKVYFGPLGTPNEIENLAKNVHVAVYLSYDLIEYAWRLAELSWERRGLFDEGKELPASSRACAAGAIAVAYAALDAAINETIVNASGILQDNGDAARARLITLASRLTLRDRLDALAATCGHSISWGTEPLFQSFDLLVAIRNRLLHHELKTARADEGYWPAARLRNLPIQIASPYRSRKDLHWYDHVLTPAGAVWVVDVACQVLAQLEHWWGALVTTIRESSNQSKSHGR